MLEEEEEELQWRRSMMEGEQRLFWNSKLTSFAVQRALGNGAAKDALVVGAHGWVVGLNKGVGVGVSLAF